MQLKIKRLFYLLLLLFCLTACGEAEQVENNVQSENVNNTNIENQIDDSEDNSANDIVDNETITVAGIYKGYSCEYVYKYDDERNLSWEEDVIEVANSYSYVHAYLNSKPDYFCVIDVGTIIYNPDFKLYDEEKYDVFINDINQLILQIPDKTDYEITVSLMKIVGKLGDLHSEVYFEDNSIIFPIFFDSIYENGVWNYYVTTCLTENSDLLYGKLLAINNVEIADVVQLVKEYVSYENEDYAITSIFDIRHNGYIYYYKFLEAIGIANDNQIIYKIEKQDKTVVDVTVSAITLEEYVEKSKINYSKYSGWNPAFDYSKKYYSWVFDEALYFSFRSTGSLSDTKAEIRDLLLESISQNKKEYVIVDFRGCYGGTTQIRYKEFAELINWGEFKKVYILIDQLSASNGVLTPYFLYTNCKNAVLIGNDASQGVNIMAYHDGIYYPECNRKTKNHEVNYVVSNAYHYMDLTYMNVLSPETYVYQTIEDYMNEKDTVLEYVFDQIGNYQ